ncbi:MAG: YceI family protein [Bacteroidia bacterium]|nr:YceI family protein [Bacteroidia bacterium]
MKIFNISLALVALFAFKAADVKNYVFDPNSSTIHWAAKKVTGAHDGTVKLKSGELTLEGDNLKAASFVVDMTSIAVDDLKDAGYNAKLVGHLKSEDFFSTEKHAEASFKLKKATPSKNASNAGKSYTVTGDLTIKGITKEITFDATIVKSGNMASAIATVKVNRVNYDIKYGSKSIFSDIGDKAIDDEFTLEIKLSGKAK